LLILIASFTESEYKSWQLPVEGWIDMEFRQLRYFIAVAEHLSFSKAADDLHVTVPPLSRQIRQLEEEFGVPLFARDRRHVALTNAGRALLPEAKALVAQTLHVSDCVRLVKQGECGKVNLGIGPGLAEHVSRVLIEHGARFPAVEFHCKDMSSNLQNKALLEDDIDVAFMRPTIDARLASEVLFQEGFTVHVSKTHPLAKRRFLRVRDLANETLLLLNRDGCPGLYDKTLELYSEAGMSPTIAHVPQDATPRSEAQIILLLCRKGILILPDEPATRPLPGAEVVAIPLDEPNAKIDVCLAWRKGEKSPAIFGLIDSARRLLSTAAPVFGAGRRIAKIGVGFESRAL
jgi:DNA-binding transcriptional LysR family regulator